MEPIEFHVRINHSFSSCDKTEVLPLNDSQSKVIDGRVLFSSQEALQDFMEGLTTNDEVAEKLPSTFISYAQAVEAEFIRIEESNDSDLNMEANILLYVDETLSEIRPVVPDGPFSGLLNKNLELRITDEVYKFNSTSAEVFKVGDDKALTFIREVKTEYEIISSTPDIGPDEPGDLTSRAKFFH